MHVLEYSDPIPQPLTGGTITAVWAGSGQEETVATMAPRDFDTTSTANRTIRDLRPLGLVDVPVIGRYRYVSSGPPLDLQIHDGYLMTCLMLTGEQPYRVSGETVQLRGGQFLIVQPGESHSTGVEPERRGELIWLFLGATRGNRRLLGFTREESRAIEHALLTAGRGPFPATSRLPRLAEDLFRADSVLASGLGTATIRTALMAFLLEVCAALTQDPGRGALSPEIRRAMELLERSRGARVDLAMLASAAGLSISRFKQRFRSEVGFTPISYATNLKIAGAKELLRHGQDEVTDIASQLGFSSAQYFSFVFRKYTGMSPSEYRRHQAPDPDEPE